MFGRVSQADDFLSICRKLSFSTAPSTVNSWLWSCNFWVYKSRCDTAPNPHPSQGFCQKERQTLASWHPYTQQRCGQELLRRPSPDFRIWSLSLAYILETFCSQSRLGLHLEDQVMLSSQAQFNDKVSLHCRTLQQLLESPLVSDVSLNALRLL